MLFKHAAQGDERAYITVKAVEAGSITTGYAVALRVGTTASFDGTNAVLATWNNVADLPAFLGIAAKDIPSNQYGIVQIFGNAPSVLVSNTATSVTFTAGDPLIPGKAPGGLYSGLPSYASSGFRYVLASNFTQITLGTLSNTGANYISGWIHW